MHPNKPPETQPVQATHGATPRPFDGRVAFTPAKPGKLLRLPAVMERCALGRSSVYAGLKNHTFPMPYRLSARAVAWREDEIDLWVSERVKAGGRS